MNHMLTESRARSQGFSLLELLVSISITGVLVFLVHSIFNDTSRAVTYGIRTSNIVAAARTMGDQLQDDAEVMQGPAAAVGTSAADTRGFIIIANNTITGVTFNDNEAAGRTSVRDVRSDSVSFLRDATALRPLTPAAANRTNNDTQNIALARVYYGHVVRTEPDGTSTPGLTGGANRIGNDWILGRQAMLYGLSGSPLVFAGGAADRYATGGGYNAPINADDSDIGTPRMVHALTDVSSVNWDLGPDPALLGADSVYRNFSYLNERLWVNPRFSLDTQLTAEEMFQTWRLAQTHPYFVGGVSDFIVEFAADLDRDGILDTRDTKGTPTTADDTVSNDPDNPLWWYDGYNIPAAEQTALAPAATESGYYDDPAVSLGTNANLADHVFVFRIDDVENGTVATPASLTSDWPYLIRIRYRVHDSQGRVYSNDPATGDRTLGQWFEHIIPVTRVN